MPAWSVDGMDVLRRRATPPRRAVDGGPRRRRAALPRAADLPLPRPLDVRPRALPRQGRGRALEAARPDRAAGGRAARATGCSTTPSSSALEAEVGGRDRRRRRVRRGRRRWSRSRTSTRFVYAEQEACRMSRRDRPRMTYREAMRDALREALRRDERVFLMGEDVGRYGGCFARQPGPARGVRPRAHPRHAAVGVGLRRRRHRRRARRHAADRRDHDGQLQPARARPDREQRRDAAAHVGRPVQRARS